MNWQDISTAPKDGTWFLGWNGFWRVVVWVDNVREGGEGEFMIEPMRAANPPLTKWTELPGRPS